MKISNVTAQVVDVGQGFSWAGRREMAVVGVWVALETEDGHQGHGLAWTAELPPGAVVSTIEHAIQPHLIGCDPFDRERLLAPAWRAFRVGAPLAAIGVVDVALWDLAGAIAGRSVAALLGQRRDRLTACASAPPVDDPQACAEMVRELAQSGFRAVKLHACGDVAVDVAACRAARAAVGDGFELMMDAMGIYGRDQALTLGRTLDECAFRWFEDPLNDDDLDGWVALRSRIDTPLAGVDAVRFTTRDLARPIADGAFDILRMDAARDGISQLHALGQLAQAFGLGCEGHAFGPALAQAANLQVGLASAGACFCELPVPLGALDYGVTHGLRLDDDGCVNAPEAPGLGLSVDRDALSRAVVG